MKKSPLYGIIAFFVVAVVLLGIIITIVVIDPPGASTVDDNDDIDIEPASDYEPNPTYEGVITDIEFDFDNDKTIIYMDTGTPVLNGIHTEFAVGMEYRLWIDSDGNLESFEEVVDEPVDDYESPNMMLIAGCIIAILAIIIIIVIVVFAMKKKVPEEEDDEWDD